jgi:hypothetical protein
MSLINDALKQTKQIRQQSPPSNPPPLSPVESASQGGLGWLVPGIVVLLLVAAGVFVGVSLSKPTRLAASALPATHTLPVAAPAIQQAKSVAITPPVATNTMANSNPVAVVPPKPPEPKLQGILFAATRPCAIVSGKTVFVGDYVNEFRVAAISKDSITLQNEAKTTVLSLSPQ